MSIGLIHSNEEPKLADIVGMINEQTINLQNGVVSVMPMGAQAEEWCSDLITLIQRYNVYHANDKFPRPAFETTMAGAVILSFPNVQGTVDKLMQAGVHIPGRQPPQSVADHAELQAAMDRSMAALGQMLSDIPPAMIARDGHTVFVKFHNPDYVRDIVSAIGDINARAMEGKHRLPNASIEHHEGGEVMLRLDAMHNDQLTMLAGSGLQFPGHELHARLYRAQSGQSSGQPDFPG